MDWVKREAGLSSLLERYGLTEERYNREVSDVHLEDISRSHCSQQEHPIFLRLLVSGLGMKPGTLRCILSDTIGMSESRRTLAFLTAWKRQRRSSATYKELIMALLGIDCDAEAVCKLLRYSVCINREPSSASSNLLYTSTGMTSVPSFK